MLVVGWFCGIICGMKLAFTYWQESDGMWLGYMNDYPEYTTEGHSLDDLKRMLISLRKDIDSDVIPGIRHNTGVLEYA